MTYINIYRETVKALKAGGIDSPEYDARCMIKYFFGIDRPDYDKIIELPEKDNTLNDFFHAVDSRTGGYPLQYIIKSWSFMDCELSLGEGVLIPNDDTEVCVRECMRFINENKICSPTIIDLCGGSGAISIELAKKYPEAKIFSLELSDKAFEYLCINIHKNKADNIKPIKGSLFDYYDNFEDNYFDILISNPPYVKTDDIPLLQREVQYEPVMALDGGKDGLVFYRGICEKWLSKLKDKGFISLEIGEELGKSAAEMLKLSGVTDVRILQDLSGLDRTVSGIYRVVQ